MGRPTDEKKIQPPHFMKGPGRAALQAAATTRILPKMKPFLAKFFKFFCQIFLARQAAHPEPAVRRALDGPPDGRKENTASTFYERPWTGRPPGGSKTRIVPEIGPFFGKILRIFLSFLC